MEFFSFLLAELLLLFLLSRQLTRSISSFLFQLTRSQKVTVYCLALLFFPGTLLHELAHFFMAQILFVPTGEMNLLPKLHGDTVRLGSVAIAQTDILRRMLIGVAPFLLGITAVLLLLFYTAASFSTLPIWALLLAGYGIFEIGNTMFASQKDMEGTIEFVGAAVILGILCYLLGFQTPFHLAATLITTQAALLKQVCLFVSLPLLLDGSVIIVIYLMQQFFFGHAR